MRSRDSSVVKKMASVTMLLYFSCLFFISITNGEKKSMDKIVIHVPYKILKHHHTHTKYKVITLPAPKNENTVIYLKEEIQPVIKHVPQVQTQEVIVPQQKVPESITPPHQQSASALLESMANHKQEADQQEQYSTIVNEQKPIESGQNTEGFIPNFTFKPMILPSHSDIIPNFSLKPMILPQQPAFIPKLFISPIMHQPYKNFIPKFTYQPMLHLPQGHYNHQPQGHSNPKYTFKPMLPPVHDNALTSSQVHKAIITPGPKTTPYKVKEEHQEDHNRQMVKHKKVPMPSTKSSRKAKSYLRPSHNLLFKSAKSIIQPDPDYEYQHVGYLIIDGKSKKIVGKNFKDGIHLSR